MGSCAICQCHSVITVLYNTAIVFAKSRNRNSPQTAAWFCPPPHPRPPPLLQSNSSSAIGFVATHNLIQFIKLPTRDSLIGGALILCLSFRMMRIFDTSMELTWVIRINETLSTQIMLMILLIYCI